MARSTARPFGAWLAGIGGKGTGSSAPAAAVTGAKPASVAYPQTPPAAPPPSPSSASTPPTARDDGAPRKAAPPDTERAPSDERPSLDLDPAARAATLLAPPPFVAPTPPPVSAPVATAIDPNVAAELLERAAFWGDGTRGLARLRFGSRARGGLAGATVVLEHDGDAVRLRVDDTSEADRAALADRLRDKLAARGVTLADD